MKFKIFTFYFILVQTQGSWAQSARLSPAVVASDTAVGYAVKGIEQWPRVLDATAQIPAKSTLTVKDLEKNENLFAPTDSDGKGSYRILPEESSRYVRVQHITSKSSLS